MEHSFSTTIERRHGSDWYTSYEVEVFGEVCPGSRGDRITPGEESFVDGDIRIEVRAAVDYRFGDKGVPLNLIAGEVTEKAAGEWLLKDHDEEEIDSIKQDLIDHWCQYMADRAADDAEARAEAYANRISA